MLAMACAMRLTHAHGCNPRHNHRPGARRGSCKGKAFRAGNITLPARNALPLRPWLRAHPVALHGILRADRGMGDGTMDERFPALTLHLPAWVARVLPPPDTLFATCADRMRLAIDLSRWNVEHDTGGPFGAAIFDAASGRLLAPGVNLVVGSRWSGAHAEMVAFAIAQQMVASHDLGSPELPPYELYASSEPCAMCFGATPWSGVRRLVCGARDADVRAIGFDEGPKLPDWADALRTRGIDVVQDLLRDEAVAVLRAYATRGGAIYNGRAGAQGRRA